MCTRCLISSTRTTLGADEGIPGSIPECTGADGNVQSLTPYHWWDSGRLMWEFSGVAPRSQGVPRHMGEETQGTQLALIRELNRLHPRLAAGPPSPPPVHQNKQMSTQDPLQQATNIVPTGLCPASPSTGKNLTWLPVFQNHKAHTVYIGDSPTQGLQDWESTPFQLIHRIGHRKSEETEKYVPNNRTREKKRKN